MKIYEVLISAETKQGADKILDELIANRMATGGQIIESPSKFLWKGEVVSMNYFTITSFTTGTKRKSLVDYVESISDEEVPMIRFVPVEVNDKLANWVWKTLEYMK